MVSVRHNKPHNHICIESIFSLVKWRKQTCLSDMAEVSAGAVILVGFVLPVNGSATVSNTAFKSCLVD